MTGEISGPVDRDAYPMHAAIADAFDGELCPFDVYQGPYVLLKNHKLWIAPSEQFPELVCHVYDERTDKLSGEIHHCETDAIDQAIYETERLTGLERGISPYRGWEIEDMGENYHPASARFQAIRYGVQLQDRTLEQLRKSIDDRIKRYPSSGGA